jgi:hypothetical protein
MSSNFNILEVSSISNLTKKNKKYNDKGKHHMKRSFLLSLLSLQLKTSITTLYPQCCIQKESGYAHMLYSLTRYNQALPTCCPPQESRYAHLLSPVSPPKRIMLWPPVILCAAPIRSRYAHLLSSVSPPIRIMLCPPVILSAVPYKNQAMPTCYPQCLPL